jgi:hypothetical protein
MGLFNSNSGGKSGNSMMIIMIGLAICFCMVSASAGGGWWYVTYGPGKPTSPPEGSTPTVVESDDDTPVSSNATGLSGQKFIKLGGQSITIDSTNCKSSRVGLRDTRETSKHVWNVNPVPGKDDYYYISSKAKQDANCPKRYLTSNSSCNSDLYVSQNRLADRQYFTFKSTGNGYQIQNVNCKNKGLPSYLSGSTKNNSNVGLQSRGDISFSLVDAL